MTQTKHIIVSFSLLLCLLICGAAQAESPPLLDKNSKKGFTFSMGTGFGGLHHSAQDDGGVFGVLGAMRLGYGFHEQIIVYGELFAGMGLSFSNYDSRAIWAASVNVGVQLFPIKDVDLFFTPHLGMGGIISFNEDLLQNDNEGSSFSAGTGVGYAIRLGKSFSIAPEFRYDYYQGGGHNGHSYGIMLNLQWF